MHIYCRKFGKWHGLRRPLHEPHHEGEEGHHPPSLSRCISDTSNSKISIFGNNRHFAGSSLLSTRSLQAT